MNTAGIYIIINNVNRKCYIGQSVNITRRFYQHKTKYKYQTKNHLYYAMNFYGIENFSFNILYKCDKTDLNKYEKFFITIFNSNNNGYNKTSGGDSNYTWSNDRKLKHSEIMTEIQNRPDVKIKNSITHIGKPGWNKGKRMTDVYCKTVSESIKNKYLNDLEYSNRVSKGTKLAMNTEETQLKIKAGLKTLYESKEYRKRLSDSHKGKHFPSTHYLYDGIIFQSREKLRKYLDIPKTTLCRYLKNGKIDAKIIS